MGHADDEVETAMDHEGEDLLVVLKTGGKSEAVLEQPEEMPVEDEDAALAAQLQQQEEEEAFPALLCQICLDVLPAQEVVTKLCGDECLAEICTSCLVQHLTAMVYSFYAGVLPKVRCPVCLTLLNKEQWAPFVTNDTQETDENNEDESAWRMDHSHVLLKYEMLCKQSCGFQSPCCHNTDYTMLPPAVRESDHEQESGEPTVSLPEGAAEGELEVLREYMRAFCFHEIPAESLYGYMQDKFDGEAEDMMWELLPQIKDEERRSTLLLYHLFLYPNTYTRCCGASVCFKCKASNHHDGQCDDFLEDDCVLQCSGCHVTLVKVDGCDSVTCICGNSIHWPSEVAKQRMQRKQLAPSSNTDYDSWLRWTHRLKPSLKFMPYFFWRKQMDPVLAQIAAKEVS